MAKSSKKAPAKVAKKAALKKAAKTPVKKTAKKAVKKIAAKAVKKQAAKAPVKKAPVKGKTFLVIYHAPLEAMAQTMNMTPEQQAEGMALWMAWAEKAKAQLLDIGAPLVNGKSVGAGGKSAPSSKEVSGYSLLSAEDWDEVMSLMEGHPHLSGWHPDATIEIHETMLMPGM